MNDTEYGQSSNRLIFQIVGVVVAVIVACLVLIPVVNATTTTTEVITEPSIENLNPVGDLRLEYSEDLSLALSFDVELEEDEGVTITGEGYSISGLTGTLILFGSDDYSLTLMDGALVKSEGGIATYVESETVTIADGAINGSVYSFVYYPSVNGKYANYASYSNEIGEQYAVGVFAGVSVMSKNGEISSVNPYGFVAEVQTEGNFITGVKYTSGEEI